MGWGRRRGPRRSRSPRRQFVGQGDQGAVPDCHRSRRLPRKVSTDGSGRHRKILTYEIGQDHRGTKARNGGVGPKAWIPHLVGPSSKAEGDLPTGAIHGMAVTKGRARRKRSTSTRVRKSASCAAALWPARTKPNPIIGCAFGKDGTREVTNQIPNRIRRRR